MRCNRSVRRYNVGVDKGGIYDAAPIALLFCSKTICVVNIADVTLTANMSFQTSRRKDSTGARCCIPALLMRISILPKSAFAVSIIALMAAGSRMSAPWKDAFTLKSDSRSARAVSISASSPKPLSKCRSLQPRVRVHNPNRYQLVEPVMTADLPSKSTILFSIPAFDMERKLCRTNVGKLLNLITIGRYVIGGCREWPNDQ